MLSADGDAQPSLACIAGSTRSAGTAVLPIILCVEALLSACRESQPTKAVAGEAPGIRSTVRVRRAADADRLCGGGLSRGLRLYPARRGEESEDRSERSGQHDIASASCPHSDIVLCARCWFKPVGRCVAIRTASELAARYRVGPGIIERVCAEVVRRPDPPAKT